MKSEAVHFMAFTRSTDGGRTWSAPEPLTTYSEIPGHLLALKDGRLLLTFGVRHYPQGVQAIFDWQAARDSTLGRMCTATLINDIEEY